MNKIIEVYKKYKEIINYLIVGGLTTVVGIGTYWLFTKTFLNPEIAWQLQIANILSWVLAVAFAYFTNRKFVFESKEENKIKEATRFVGGRVVTLLIDMLMETLQF